jgi:hypothetical protein
MWIGAVSTLFLILALNSWIDNDQGTYRINRPVFFTVISCLVIIFIYGSQKIAQLKVVREIRIYLSDIQNEVLEGSHKIEQAKRKYFVFFLILVIILTIFFILGIIKSMSA